MVNKSSDHKRRVMLPSGAVTRRVDREGLPWLSPPPHPNQSKTSYKGLGS